MTKVCRICKINFRVEIGLESFTICRDCTKAIEEVILKDDAVASIVVSALIKNNSAMTAIGKAMLSIPMKDIGLGGPGSIAEFFREEIDS